LHYSVCMFTSPLRAIACCVSIWSVCASSFAQNTSIPAKPHVINVTERAPATGDAPDDPGPLATDVSNKLVRADVHAAMRKVADWQYERVKNAPSQDWTFAPLYDGFLAASQTLEEPKYRDLVIAVGEHFHWTIGTGALRTNANEHALGYFYVKLYEGNHDPKKLADLQREFEDIKDVRGNAGGDPIWWWCDALFMAPPTWSALARATHDSSYVNYMDTQYHMTDDLLWSKQYHLYFRDKNFLNRTEANGEPIFWSRGNGWVFAGLAMVLDSLPKDDARRAFYLERYREMAAEVLSIQGEDGLWRTGLLDAGSYAHPEVSGSAFFLYGMAWGVNHGLLDRKKYGPAIVRGWAGLVNNIYADGRLGNIQPVGDSPGKYKPSASYVFGVGAFLLAGSETEKLALK
jgi:unsaturated rhamnogalacturonyl hydrolase